MKFLEYLERAFVVRGCILCDTPLDYNRELPICDECKSHLVDQLDLLCPRCGYESEYCTCIPRRIEGKVDFLTFCYFYKSGYGNPANGIVYKLKRDYNREVIDFCAKQMKKQTIKEFAKQNMSYRDYIVTYPPRRKDGVIDYGYDHAQLLAKRYARLLGLKVESCFKNVGKKEQKTLTKLERMQNALQSFIPKDGINTEGKKFILIDDVITSGSTINACASLLKRTGAKSVVAVCYAKDI